jgi:hypothetical protein
MRLRQAARAGKRGRNWASPATKAEEANMTSVIAYHDVDDVDHRLRSPRRDEIFGPLGITIRTFVDPEGSKRTGLIMEVPDMAKLQAVMASEVGSEAMRYDGVHADSVAMLAASGASSVGTRASGVPRH